MKRVAAICLPHSKYLWMSGEDDRFRQHVVGVRIWGSFGYSVFAKVCNVCDSTSLLQVRSQIAILLCSNLALQASSKFDMIRMQA
ncbi:hypothetical protein AVEN_44477-1 [Araneus ventricosus]|uniref:Uncharacterized protein n=1 Tax=Araneus ventricosus TaxID=182803 RepID=A0A4Y2P361_ARAVE|nr:hypothetical protein AVEN_44477-1 [Araneus ventricosus]